MDPLATVADLEARTRDLTTAEEARALVLLGDASAKIRTYLRQDISAVEDDTIVLRPIGVFLRLPQRPVTAVTSVAVTSIAPAPDITIPVGAYKWDKVDLIELYPFQDWIVNLPESWADGIGNIDSYTVVYDHGYNPVPADIIAVCCEMVARTVFAPSMVAGLTSERIGEYGYQYGQFAGGQSPGTAVRLTEEDKDALAPYRVHASTIAMRIR